jgi:hypothetical protein
VTYEDISLLEGYILVGIILVLTLTVPVLLLYTIGLVAYRSWKRRPPKGTLLRCLALLSTCAAATMYFWGCLHLVSDDRSADEICKANVPRELAGELIYYEISFIPLKNKCHVDNANTYDITKGTKNWNGVVPRYVNPSVAVAAGVAVVAFVTVRRFPDEDPSQIEPGELEPEEGVTP